MENMRAMGDEICYRAKECQYLTDFYYISSSGTFAMPSFLLIFHSIWPDLTISKLFTTRADLYRTVYTHPKVKVRSIDSLFSCGIYFSNLDDFFMKTKMMI